METEYFSFNPGTVTCHAPLATTFEHVLKFVTKAEQFLTIHSQEDITNVNSLLEQTLNLQVSNIIQRVIAQVIGEYRDGFVTIKGTEGGQLHVYLAGSDETLPIHVNIEAGTNLIGKVQIEGTSQTVKQAKIYENTAASNVIVAAVTGKKICVVNIAFTVDAEANITLQSDGDGISGAMDFGGTNEPRGMVAHHGNFPLKTASGEAFKILSNTTARISGYCTYYEE